VNSHVWGSLLFGKYAQVNVPHVDDFIGSIPTTFTDMVNMIRSRSPVFSDEVTLGNRKKLQLSIRKFHIEADTLTSDVSNKIASLIKPNTEIFVSTHQPNLFPYSGILKKIVLLNVLKDAVENLDQNKKVTALFVVLDHDFMDELWVHVAQLPSIWNSLGTLDLRMPVSKSISRKMISSIPVPTQTVLDSWKMQVKRWIAKCTSSNPDIRSRIIDNFNRYWTKVEETLSKAKTYGDFNSFLMSQLVNKEWQYDTLFVRVTDLFAVFEEGYKYLVANFSAYSEALRETEKVLTDYGIKTNVSSRSFDYFPLWLHCNCGSKAPTKIANEQESITLVGICLSCKKTLKAKIGSNGRAYISEELLQYLSPRAISLLLLLSRELGITCYCSGVGAIDYMIYGNAVFDVLSIKRPLIVFWPSRDVYNGIAQCEAINLIANAQQNVKDPLQGLKELKEQEIRFKYQIKALITERSREVKNRGHIDSILDNLFQLKEQQRNFRNIITLTEKGIRVLKVSPCLVDYAVNFGIKNIESYWRQSLFRCDDLSAPVLFDRNLAANKQILNFLAHRV
jgi:hypothetical protein